MQTLASVEQIQQVLNKLEKEIDVEDVTTNKNDDEIATYEMQFDAPYASDENIKECIDFNIKDELRIRKFQIKDSAYDIKRKESKLVVKKSGENFKSLKTFEIKAKNEEEIKEAIEVFKVVWEFDPLGFKCSEQDKKYATLEEFKHI